MLMSGLPGKSCFSLNFLNKWFHVFSKKGHSWIYFLANKSKSFGNWSVPGSRSKITLKLKFFARMTTWAGLSETALTVTLVTDAVEARAVLAEGFVVDEGDVAEEVEGVADAAAEGGEHDPLVLRRELLLLRARRDPQRARHLNRGSARTIFGGCREVWKQQEQVKWNIYSWENKFFQISRIQKYRPSKTRHPN